MTIPISPFTTARISDDTYSLTLAQLTSVFIAELERLLGPREPQLHLRRPRIRHNPRRQTPHLVPQNRPSRPRNRPEPNSHHYPLNRQRPKRRQSSNLATSPRMRPPNRPLEHKTRRPSIQLPRRGPSHLVPKHHHPKHPQQPTPIRRSQIPSHTTHAPTSRHHQTPPHQPQPPHQRNRRSRPPVKPLPRYGHQSRRQTVPTVRNGLGRMSCVCDLHVRPICTHIQNVVLTPTYCPVWSDPHALKQRPIFPHLPHATPDVPGKIDDALYTVFEFDPNLISLKRLYLRRFDQCTCLLPLHSNITRVISNLPSSFPRRRETTAFLLSNHSRIILALIC